MDRDTTPPVERGETKPPPAPPEGMLGGHVVREQKKRELPPEQLPQYQLYEHVREFKASPSLAKFGQIIKDVASVVINFFTFWKTREAPAKEAEVPKPPDHSAILQKAMVGGNEAADFIALFRAEGKKDEIVKQAEEHFEQVKREFQAATMPDVDKLARAFLIKEAAKHFRANPPTEETKSLMSFAMGNLTRRSQEFSDLVSSLGKALKEDSRRYIVAACSPREDLAPPREEVKISPAPSEHATAFVEVAKGKPVLILRSMQRGNPEEAVRLVEDRYDEAKRDLLQSQKTPKELVRLAGDMRLSVGESYCEGFRLLREEITARKEGFKKQQEETRTEMKKIEIEKEAQKGFLITYRNELAKVNGIIAPVEGEIKAKQVQISDLEKTLQANALSIRKLSEEGGAEKNQVQINKLKKESNDITESGIPALQESIEAIKKNRDWEALLKKRSAIDAKIIAGEKFISDTTPDRITEQITIYQKAARELDKLETFEKRLQDIAANASVQPNEQLKALLIAFAQREAVIGYQSKTNEDPQTFWVSLSRDLKRRFEQELWSMGITPQRDYTIDFVTL